MFDPATPDYAPTAYRVAECDDMANTVRKHLDCDPAWLRAVDSVRHDLFATVAEISALDSAIQSAAFPLRKTVG